MTDNTKEKEHETPSGPCSELKILTDKKHSFEYAGIILFILSAIAGGLNYLFQILGGRFLSVSMFGSLTAVIAIQGIFGVFGKALMTSVAVNTAEIKENNLLSIIPSVFKRILPYIFLFTCLSFFLIIILDCSIATSILIILSALILLFEYSLYGILQRLNDLASIGFLELLPPIFKIILCLPLMCFGMNAEAFPLSIIVAGTCGSVIASFLIKKRTNAEKNNKEFNSTDIAKKITSHYFSSLITNAILVLFGNIDIILFKQMFGEELLGQYAAASLFGKAVLYISSSLVTVMIPTVANSNNKFKILNKTLFYTVVLSVLMCSCFFIVKKPVVALLMGEKFLTGLYLFIPACLSMIALSAMTITANFLLTISDKKFLSLILILSSLLIVFLSVFVFNNSPVRVLYLLTAVYSISSVIFYIRGKLLLKTKGVIKDVKQK